MMEVSDEKRKQVALQCKAVVHLCGALTEVFSDYAKVLSADERALHNILDSVGNCSASIMETLGDILNGMDACEEADDWMTPVFEKAHQMFPQATPCK